MSACPCCPSNLPSAEGTRRPAETRRYHPARLFNRVSVLLLTGWVGIVAFALKKSDAALATSLPSLEAFATAFLLP